MKRFFVPSYLLGAALVVQLLGGCKRNEEITPAGNAPARDVNGWVYSVMQDAYFWSDKMPAQNTLDASQSPFDFFEKLVYQRPTVDRFSEITDDIGKLQASFNGVNKIFGLRYLVAPVGAGQSSLAMYLSHVVKGSPADLAGLRRGDILVRINGQAITTDALQTTVGTSETVTFTKGTVQNGVAVANNDQGLTLTRATVAENPVAFARVLDKPAAGKKVGYLLYTQFVPGVGNDSLRYDNQLRQTFADFKARGINELVLDLRLNGGGYISSATTLASLIVKTPATPNVFYKDRYNDKYQAYFQNRNGAAFFNHPFQAEANNVGGALSRVFVLTSQGTASASELIINGLRPFMAVQTVGDHTAGKNLFGTLVSDDQKRWNWGIYLMLGQTTNALGQSDYGTVNGIPATLAVPDNAVPFLPFGNENEPLLNKALVTMGITTDPNGRVAASQRAPVVAAAHQADGQVPAQRMIR